MKLVPNVLGDGLAQLRKPQVGSVSGATFLQRKEGRLSDVPRGDKVRFSDTERNDIVHRLNDFEEITNARAWDVAHMRRNFMVHGLSFRG